MQNEIDSKSNTLQSPRDFGRVKVKPDFPSRFQSDGSVRFLRCITRYTHTHTHTHVHAYIWAKVHAQRVALEDTRRDGEAADADVVAVSQQLSSVPEDRHYANTVSARVLEVRWNGSNDRRMRRSFAIIARLLSSRRETRDASCSFNGGERNCAEIWRGGGDGGGGDNSVVE